MEKRLAEEELKKRAREISISLKKLFVFFIYFKKNVNYFYSFILFGD
jgi:hypothetical protein